MSASELLFFHLGTVCYAISLGFAARYVASNVRANARWSKALVLVGFAAQTIALVLWTGAHGRLPTASLEECFLALAWAACVAYLCLDYFFRVPVLGLFFVPAMVLVSAGVVFLRPENEAGASASSGLTVAHGVTALVACALFAVGAAGAAMYLAQESGVRAGSFGPLMWRLPALKVLDRLAYRSIALGFTVYTVSVVTGIMAMRKGTVWRVDAGLGVLVWLLYALILHLRLSSHWRGRKIAYLAILGFAVVAVTFVVIGLIAAGTHRL